MPKTDCADGFKHDIIRKYFDTVYRLALSRTNSREMADDVVQDVFLKYIEYVALESQKITDKVEAGEQLCAGSPNPQDVLAILGENALQNYLMDEIQQVYRAQGVDISDKHIEVIAKRMISKIKIINSDHVIFENDDIVYAKEDVIVG